MGGPNMEVFRFGMYVFFPIAMYYITNLPEYYNKFVVPLKERVSALENKEHVIPHTEKGNAELLAQLKAKARQNRLDKEAAAAAAAAAAATNGDGAAKP